MISLSHRTLASHSTEGPRLLPRVHMDDETRRQVNAERSMRFWLDKKLPGWEGGNYSVSHAMALAVCQV